ncbi:YjcZ family sporulation protein [Bacillus horikoshii]
MHDYCYYTCGPCGYPAQVAPAHGYGCGNTFVLIVVLFILLIIVGACYCK